MTLDHSNILQVDATMIVGILIFLSFSGSLFQGTNPMVEIEKMRQEAQNVLTDLRNSTREIISLVTEINRTMAVEEIQKMKNESENIMDGTVVSAQNLTQESQPLLQQRLVELQNRKNELEIRMHETVVSAQNLTQEPLQMKIESTGRLLQVTFTSATLVPFSISSLILLVYNLRMPQSELEKKELEKKYLRISVIVMLSGFVILVIFLLYLTYTAFEVGLKIEQIGSLT